jgi:hypothetical protein
LRENDKTTKRMIAIRPSVEILFTGIPQFQFSLFSKLFI